jgi:hypothetical protein
MKRILLVLFLLAALSHSAASQEKSFIILGDLHFDRMDLHDWTWLRENMPKDTSQIINYSKIMKTNFRDLVSELASKARTSVPPVRGIIQLGDFQEGLAGSEPLALKMAKDALDSMRSAEFLPPWILTKGNHDITGPGATAAYQSVVLPFLQSELGQPVTAAYYSYRVDDVQIFVMDSYDLGPMMSYLDTALANSTAKYKILTTHMPVIPVTARLWHIFEQDDAQRTILLNLLARYKVLVLAGHLHKYSFVRRVTPYGPVVQIMVGSVIDDRNEHSAVMTKKYGGNLIDLEPTFDPPTDQSRRQYLDTEAKFVTDFRMSDLPGYGVLSLNSASDSWILKYYGGLGGAVSDSVNLSLCRLKLRSTGMGNVVVSPNDSSFMLGSQVVVKAVPALGWKFIGWSGALTGSANPATIVMDDEKELIANFESIPQGLYEMRIDIEGAGTVVRSIPGPYYALGTQVVLTAQPDAGQKFEQWTGALTGNTSPVTVTVNGHTGIAAVFRTIPMYKLNVRSGSIGSVVPTPASGMYADGTPVTLTASGIGGWSFYEWTGDLKGKNNPEILTMSGDKEVRPLFRKNGTAVIELTANEDTYVRGGIAYQGKNFNADPFLLVREGASTMNQARTFLKFDASGIRGNVLSAFLKLHVSADGLPDDGPVKAAAYPVSNDAWAEATMKWSGAPVLGGMLDSTTIITQTETDCAFDVTNAVVSKMTGNKLVSLAVKDPSSGDRSARFDTREGTHAPTLVIVSDDPSAVSGTDVPVPVAYRLHHSFPNPFNPTTTIGFDLAAAGDVKVHVYDMLGKQVAVLADGRMKGGTYSIQWDASHLSSAVYFVRLTAGGSVCSDRILLAK